MKTGKMRRWNREITDNARIEKILKEETVCHLAMCADDQPYVIPVYFVYEDGYIYVHCAEVGTKLDIIARNDRVCFEVKDSIPEEIITNAGRPCDWGIPYASVVGFGTAAVSDDREEKIKAFDLLVDKLHPPGYDTSENLYTEKKITGSRLIRIRIDSMTGKEFSGHKPL